MNASNYTYVRVKTGAGDIWAASATFKVAVGDKVVVPLEMAMENFHSTGLNRDFPLIYFASHIGKEGEPVAPAMMPSHGTAGAPAASPGPMQTPPVATEPGTGITPAPGGSTVADVWTRRKALAGKDVTVRGKVVKVNHEILGRNWVHIQDGTGNAKDGSNDLTVTSKDAPKVGDVVTITGKVAVDRDFGAGYAYAVIVETATIVLK